LSFCFIPFTFDFAGELDILYSRVMSSEIIFVPPLGIHSTRREKELHQSEVKKQAALRTHRQNPTSRESKPMVKRKPPFRYNLSISPTKVQTGQTHITLASPSSAKDLLASWLSKCRAQSMEFRRTFSRLSLPQTADFVLATLPKSPTAPDCSSGVRSRFHSPLPEISERLEDVEKAETVAALWKALVHWDVSTVIKYRISKKSIISDTQVDPASFYRAIEYCKHAPFRQRRSKEY
jgi:hypothetical protein